MVLVLVNTTYADMVVLASLCRAYTHPYFLAGDKPRIRPKFFDDQFEGFPLLCRKLNHPIGFTKPQIVFRVELVVIRYGRCLAPTIWE